MKVYRSLQEFTKLTNAVVTTGTFDGVHQGHKVIINRLKQITNEINGESVILTFNPHPRHVLFAENTDLKLLSTIDEKIHLLEKEQIDHLLIIPFTKSFSRIQSVDFVRDILVNTIGTKHLVIGYNHQFGRNREGTFEHLKEYSHLYGFEVEEIPAQLVDEVKVSSTKIRLALGNCDIIKANTYLGYNYTISGKVVHGNQIGRKLGFPTANIRLDSDTKLIPSAGVYAVQVTIDSCCFKGMMNIGNRPTLTNQEEITLEVHLFDFNDDIYGKFVTISFFDFIRKEIKFSSTEAMVDQLIKDEHTSRSKL